MNGKSGPGEAHFFCERDDVATASLNYLSIFIKKISPKGMNC